MLNDASYVIYTFEDNQNGQPHKWDLHATAENQDSAILHAKMLALQPRFTKIQVERLQDNPSTGHRVSKTIRVFKKNHGCQSAHDCVVRGIIVGILLIGTGMYCWLY